jgi:hypothetical protein
MNSFRHTNAVHKVWLSVWAALALVAALVLTGPAARAQSSMGSIEGTVYDTSSALVPGATIILKNQASGDQRTDLSNSEGFFNFAAVPPGVYTLKVSRQGFATWEAKDITLDSGGHVGVSSIKLKVGSKDETVVVEATSTQITPSDTGDKAFTIGQDVMQNVAIIGQNAAEFIKIMPGMAMTSGVLNSSSYAASNEGTGSGPVGSFSANGQRVGALDITSDGAHIVDPGCNCGQAMNTNVEMTSEVTVQTSNFGADSAKGPVVINAVGKSGGQQYHGEVYIYSRYYDFNANDWLNNVAGISATTKTAIAPRPHTAYYYPGAQFGGPVILPKLNFNRNHDKLFFFFATEAYRQIIDDGIYHAAVPTTGTTPYTSMNMRGGQYTDSGYLSKLSGGAIQGVPNGGGITHNAYTNGIVNAAQIDPNGQAMVGVFPGDDANPAVNQGFNYISAKTRFANMIQYRARVDYSISNSTKLFVQYNHQNDNAEESLDTLWIGSQPSWASPTAPYPSPIVSESDSEVVTANMTKVFTPTLTNEVLFNWVYLDIPNQFQDISKVSRAGLGINYTMLFNHPNQPGLIFPELQGWGNGVANMLNSGFEFPGGVFAKKTLPSLADNITKVWKTHTAKFGFYWERTWNQQPGNGAVNGSTGFTSWGANSSGNMYADMLIGETGGGYGEQNFNVVPAFRYLSTQFYGADSWKVSRKLTLDLGLRLSHLGPWVDTTGYGFAAWYPALYPSGTGGTVAGATFPGVQWHAENASTPLSGSASRFAFYSPRVGFAWDTFGTGKTILRGGYGIYNFHDEQNVQNGAYGIVRGSFSNPGVSINGGGPNVCTTPTSCTWSGRFEDLMPLAAFGQGLSIPNGVTVLDPTDSEEPQTQDWSLTVAQRAPWKSLVEIAYVGNKSDYLSNYNNAFGEPNNLGTGALNQYGWMPQCFPAGATHDGGACSTGTTSYTSAQINSVEEFPAYGSIKIINHQMYSNYHSLQATWNKQQGHFTYLLNYTFSKALGIRGENGAATGDPTSLKDNYGTLPNNRPNIFNAAYVYQVPNLKADANKVLKGAVNGWQISGITQFQTGADLQAAVTSNFNYSAYIPAGTTYLGKTIDMAVQANDSNVIGTPNITLMPKVICNPHSGLQPHQFVNPSCFANFAVPGQQGTFIFPTTTGPHYLNSDLSVFKNFAFGASENKKLTFRFSGYNFLNHPNRSFQNGDSALKLTFDANGVNQPAAPGAPFGYALYKTGHRIVQGEARFSF